MIYINGKVYDYGFALDKMYVHEEWLEVLTEKGFKPMFERKTDENRISSIEIFSKYAKKGSANTLPFVSFDLNYLKTALK